MKYRIVIVSKDESFKMTHEQYAPVLDRAEVTQVSNNSKTLPEVYNKYIDEVKSGGFDQTLILMHSDVQLDLSNLLDRIEQCSGRYDVMGLCGTAVLDVSQSPLNWFCGSRPTPNERWGSVIHGELGNSKSFFSSHHPDVLDHEVACIDGLCIIMTPVALMSGLRFNEQFKYDCYDTQISLDTIMKHHLRLGVIVDKSLQHYSVGRSIMKDDFLESELKLRKLYGFDVPRGSRLEQLIAEKKL